MTIKLGEFDDIESFNMFAIKDIMEEIATTAPNGTKVSWEFPGYVSIVLSNGREIAFGESLENESGYSWNCYELDGTNDACDSFGDLKDIKEIVNKLWAQTAPLLEKGDN